MSISNLSDGQKLARLIRFYYQPYEPRRTAILSIDKVPYKSFYMSNKQLFDKAAKIFSKYGISVEKLVKYLVSKKKMTLYNVKSHILNAQFISDFILRCQTQQKEKHIVKKFVETAEFVSSKCVELGYVTTIDFIRHLIRHRKLASYYAAGKLSKYFLTTIPKFPKVIEKLDGISKDEFQQIYDRYDTYKSDVRIAMMHQINKVLSPLSYTDELIQKKRSTLKTLNV